MENKRKVYEVLEEKISPDNIVRISELLALGALKYMCGHKMLHGMYADLSRDIAYKDAEGYVLTESYDLVQEAAMFLCSYMGMTVNESKDGEQYTVRQNALSQDIRAMESETVHGKHRRPAEAQRAIYRI